MDASHINTTRKFAAYHVTELEASVALYEAGTHPLQAYTAPEKIAAMKAEIAARYAGTSKHFIVPQIP